MKIKPLEHAEFDLVEVKTTNECRPTPHCKKHGAMNKITPDGIWRCITVAGYSVVMNGNSRAEVHRENICRAGCVEIANPYEGYVFYYEKRRGGWLVMSEPPLLPNGGNSILENPNRCPVFFEYHPTLKEAYFNGQIKENGTRYIFDGIKFVETL